METLQHNNNNDEVHTVEPGCVELVGTWKWVRVFQGSKHQGNVMLNLDTWDSEISSRQQGIRHIQVRLYCRLKIILFNKVVRIISDYGYKKRNHLFYVLKQWSQYNLSQFRVFPKRWSRSLWLVANFINEELIKVGQTYKLWAYVTERNTAHRYPGPTVGPHNYWIVSNERHESYNGLRVLQIFLMIMEMF